MGCRMEANRLSVTIQLSSDPPDCWETDPYQSVFSGQDRIECRRTSTDMHPFIATAL